MDIRPPQHKPPHRHPGGPHHNRGKFYRGIHYKHWCYSHNWHGYTRRIWYRPYEAYLYWYQPAGCWYRFDGTIYYPVPTLTDPHLGY